MRGIVAKRIRRQVYGDMSHRARDYKALVFDKFLALFKAGKSTPFTVVDRGLRGQYKRAKRLYMAAT